MTRRRGFTLIEILVSLMILSVVSTAMLGILLTATELYRTGQASRAAHDELVAITAALEDDLARLVPERDGGWLRARVRLNNGGMAVSMLVTGADVGRVEVSSNRIVGRRRMVVWWVDQLDRLRRHETDEPVAVAPQTREDAFTTAVTTLPLDVLTFGNVMTTGCLHFSLVASMPDMPRDITKHWEPTDDAGLLPDPTMPDPTYDRHVDGFPETVAIRLVLTGGGRFAPEGIVVRDEGTSIRIAGVRSYPTIPGSFARIGAGANSEWVAYRSGGPAVLDVSSDALAGTGRQRLYSGTASPPAGGGPMPVRFGQLVTLVRSVPR